ncbi:hypothetical protein GCM10017600_07040 [Streptosporangium carneum]|uniref:Uncharacterized protein n=1 Tax=Streptosporangium carneum TaxID=47481 RepID=A0A9W6MAH1_9ACTN|nr:hypothetical protein GCM10017600_07040 [Streptosporangium carneum]
MGVLQDGRIVCGGRSSAAAGAAGAARLEVEEVDHLPHLRRGERRMEQGGGVLHGPGVHAPIMPLPLFHLFDTGTVETPKGRKPNTTYSAPVGSIDLAAEEEDGTPCEI